MFSLFSFCKSDGDGFSLDQCFAQRNQRATTERDAGLQRPVGTAGMTTPAKIRDPAAAEGPGAALGSL